MANKRSPTKRNIGLTRLLTLYKQLRLFLEMIDTPLCGCYIQTSSNIYYKNTWVRVKSGAAGKGTGGKNG